MAKSFKSAIAFGLVYIPVDLYSCVKSKDIGFNMLYKKTGERIHYKKTCQGCPALINNEDIIKGYQYEKGKYVTLSQAELEKIKTEKEKSITIDCFVNLKEIDPIYFEKSYYLVPQGAEKAFALLLKALESQKKVGIAKTVLGEKENVVALRSENGNLLLSTLHFYDEIQECPAKNIDIKIDKTELDLAQKIIENMSKKFVPSAYKDEYRERLMSAIETKINGKKIVGEKTQAKPSNVLNLLDALKKSVKQTQTNKNKKKSKQKIVKMQKRA